MMKVRSIVWIGVVLAGSIAGLGLFERSETVPAPESAPVSAPIPEVQPIEPDIKVQPLETAVSREVVMEPPVETAQVSEVEEVVEIPAVEPVQNWEQRGDAMLFEVEALHGTPFN
ncbi:hypothetical protein P4E94_14900 [Pontiellaceae bacterium B12219]|nr:hypothetical protein [Pontiellaceae bacterium B12219]